MNFRVPLASADVAPVTFATIDVHIRCPRGSTMTARSRPFPALPLAPVRAALPVAVATPAAAASAYRVGVGVADITGQAAEVGMLGYADPAQTTAGIHTR